ncbi:SDR family oxidoreductase [Actinoplanes sp. NPDC051470]|uniref:SDR family oxidoreductase n=1 Tax=unclassified Actinoplanes TaxID=2626549 RepID=UPI0034481C02
MRIFVTGASGWIGSGTVKELVGAGHSVLGLARSDAAAERVTALGADVHRGDLNDLDSLRAGAAAADGVVHLGYHHDFSQIPEAARIDREAMAALGAELKEGSPFVIAAGVVGLSRDGSVATEEVEADASTHPRVANSLIVRDLAERGVRSAAVRFAPTVHGRGDHGFIAVLVAIARQTGVSGYVGDGAGRWSAVHRDDAATLVRLAVERATPGETLHAIAEEGVPTRDIAEAIGRGLGLPVESRPAEHFDWLGRFFGMDAAASSEITRKRYDWNPSRPGLIADLDEGHYFEQ